MTCKICKLSGYLPIFLLVSMLSVSCGKEEAPTIIPPIDVLEVTTSEAKAITTSSAICGGIIISDGGTPILTKGICWSASPFPTIADSIIEDGMDSNKIIITLTDLMTYTKYYVRAYATNSDSTAYGEETSFTTQGGTVTDIDGHVYHTISIGSQVWMAENLRVTRYRNGDSLSQVTDGQIWKAPWNLPSLGVYCYYNNDPANGIVYGALYNFITVIAGEIAPEGWHVPTVSEWKVLSDNNGINKEPGTTHWKSPNVGEANAIGLSALPGGSRNRLGVFEHIRESANFWSSTSSSSGGFDSNGYYIWLGYKVGYYLDGGIDQKYGFSIRCIKD